MSIHFPPNNYTSNYQCLSPPPKCRFHEGSNLVCLILLIFRVPTTVHGKQYLSNNIYGKKRGRDAQKFIPWLGHILNGKALNIHSLCFPKKENYWSGWSNLRTLWGGTFCRGRAFKEAKDWLQSLLPTHQEWQWPELATIWEKTSCPLCLNKPSQIEKNVL